MRLFEAELVEPFAPLDAGPLVVLAAPETAEFVWLAPKFAEAAWLVSEPGKVDPLVPGAEDVDVVSVDVDPPVLGAEDVDVDVDPPVLGIEGVDVDVDGRPGFDAGTLEFGEVVAPLDAGPLAAPVNVLAVVAEVLAAADVEELAVVAEALEELGLPETDALELARSAIRGTGTAWLVGASVLIWVGVLAAADVEELDEAGGLTLWAANGGRSVVVEESRPPLVALARPTR